MSKCLPKAASTLDAWLDDSFLDDFDEVDLDVSISEISTTITTTPSDVCEAEKISLKDLILKINKVGGVGGQGSKGLHRYVRVCLSIDEDILRHIDMSRQNYGIDRSKFLAYAALSLVKKLEDAS